MTTHYSDEQLLCFTQRPIGDILQLASYSVPGPRNVGGFIPLIGSAEAGGSEEHPIEPEGQVHHQRLLSLCRWGFMGCAASAAQGSVVS